MNEMRKLMESIKHIEEGKDRPYICVHAKKGKHECKADSSYAAVKKAADKWGLKSTAGIDAHLADITHSTQFVGEGYFSELDIENQEKAIQWIKTRRKGPLTLEQIKTLGRESFQELSRDVSEHVFKRLHKEWELIPPRFPKKFDSARWALDYAQEHGGTATRQGNMDYSAVAKKEEGIKEVYISEDWPHQEETHAEMVEYWKSSLSQSIVQKKVFTQLYTAANNDIDELNAAIADQAESIADSYHGTGEGIGSSDVNHFIAHIGSSLGIEDLFGWNKPSKARFNPDPQGIGTDQTTLRTGMASDEDMERDKTNRYAKYNTAIRGKDGLIKTGLLDDDIDEGVGDWIKRLDNKAADWISAKAARHMAKKVAKAVDEEGADSLGFDLSFGNKKGNASIIAALETYLENEPEGEYSEQIRYVLPAQAKERDKWDDIMRQAEEVFGFDVRESVNEGVLSWAADKLMDKVVREIDKVGMDSVVVSLTARAESMCHSLKTYLQERDPEEIGIEKYGKLIKLRQMLNCEGRVNEAVVKVPRPLRGLDPDNSLGGTSQEAEAFVNSLGPDDTVSTDVVDPETGELLDWPDKGTRRALGQKQYKRDELAKQKDADNDYERGWDSPVLYAPAIDRNPDSAFDTINELKYDREFLDFYNIVWKQIEDLVDAPETYAESDYDIGYEVPTAIKRTDGKKFGDQDHENFRLLNKLYRAGTYNIGLAYAGATENGTVARFYPTFH